MDVIKIGIVSLGCAKNLVDSELILGMFKKGNFMNSTCDIDYIMEYA